jgi:hypothetical protein
MSDVTIALTAAAIFFGFPLGLLTFAFLKAVRDKKRDDEVTTGDGFNVESLREWRAAKWRQRP